jgi:phage baseplate assembly protein W
VYVHTAAAFRAVYTYIPRIAVKKQTQAKTTRGES